MSRSVASDETFDAWLALPENDSRTIEEFAAVSDEPKPITAPAQTNNRTGTVVGRVVTVRLPPPEPLLPLDPTPYNPSERPGIGERFDVAFVESLYDCRRRNGSGPRRFRVALDVAQDGDPIPRRTSTRGVRWAFRGIDVVADADVPAGNIVAEWFPD